MSGPTVASTYDKYGEETVFKYRPESRPWLGCMDVDHDKCPEDSLTCVGMEDTNYVYGLENSEFVLCIYIYMRCFKFFLSIQRVT